LLLEQPPAAGIPLLLAYGITPSIYDTSFAVSYGEMADMHGMKAPYHLVVNTGMNRLGVHFEQALEFLRQVSFHRALELEGVFTQFASAECSEPLDLRIQAKRFVECVGQIQSAGIEPGIVHAANSAAALRYPDVQFDMVRLGTALYGCHPCPETREFANLRPVMSVHARIVDTHVPPMSEGVSYGWNYRSPGSVKICTIPLGYADGLRRNLSGQIDFVMAGRYHRQVGEICMGHTMFEVDMRRYGKRERLDPKVGDEVVVIGSQGIAELTVDEMAEKLGTIPYEVLVGFGSRLNRAYS
jgi:alanine racemase